MGFLAAIPAAIGSIGAGAATAAQAVIGGVGSAIGGVGSALAATPLTAATAVGAVGMGLQAYGNYQQTQAQNEAIDYNAQIEATNAALAEAKAQDAKVRGEEEESRHRQKVALMKGQTLATMSASGVSVSPLDTSGGQNSVQAVMEDIAYMGEIDAQTIRYNTQMEVAGYKQNAVNSLEKARLLRSSKGNAWLSTVPSLLTGTSSLIDRYQTRKGLIA